MLQSSWAHAPQLLSLCSGARVLQLLKPTHLEPVLHTGEATAVGGPRTATESGPCSPQLERACAQQQRPNTAKNK